MSYDVRDLILPHVRRWREEAADAAIVIGVCGAQGSGKSTVSSQLVDALNQAGLAACAISLDDFYLTADDRRRLASEVHPLLRTRGVPGTHDVALAIATIEELREHRPIALPAFDKATDDRVPMERWNIATGKYDVILFEGWCVGATPEAEVSLSVPVNALEVERDTQGVWRRYVNVELATAYRPLFDLIDRQILLAAPSFAVVEDWRLEQEDSLARRQSDAGKQIGSLMKRAEIKAFIQHYQRLTEHILRSMPVTADLTIQLASDRRPLSLNYA